jgi:hypothetical protein
VVRCLMGGPLRLELVFEQPEQVVGHLPQ